MLENNKWRVWSSDFECGPMLLDEMTRRLVQEFQPEQVILFGSHAWGTPNQDSDIDLMVIVKHSEQSDYERIVRGYRCLSGIHIPKDIIVKTKAEFDFFRSVRASLEYKIVAEGKVLYERGVKGDASDAPLLTDHSSPISNLQSPIFSKSVLYY